jgi:hypothetical protein
MNEQQNEYLNSTKKLEKLIKTISVLLIFFGVLTVFLLVKMYKMDNTLNRLSYIISNETKEYNNKDILDVFVEESDVPETLLPLYDEINSEQNTDKNEQSTNNSYNSNPVTNVPEIDSNNKPNSSPIEDTTNNTSDSEIQTYVININSKKIHYLKCSFVNRMKEENKETVKLSKSELKNYINNGYTFCSTCGG